MAISGTTNFAPSIGSVMAYAYGLAGIRRSEIAQEHLADAAMAANLLLAQWNTKTPNLWKVSEVVQTLVEGVATYDVDPSVIMVLDAFIRINAATSQPIDRIIWPISRTEYAAIPNKTIEAPPTVYWFDRLLSPTITLWQVPDATASELHYYTVTRIDDAALSNGQTLDLPNWWLPAFAFGLAALLAISYAPDRAVGLDAKAKELLAEARDQDVENVPLVIAPGLYNYYVRR